MRQAAAATEFVGVPIDVSADPTDLATEIAVVDVYAPTPEVGDDAWHTADWKEGAADPYVIQLLVGPGDGGQLELTAGRWYSVCARIVDLPEEPIRRVGPLIAF